LDVLKKMLEGYRFSKAEIETCRQRLFNKLGFLGAANSDKKTINMRWHGTKFLSKFEPTHPRHF